jgi:hypothetical protein
MFRTRDSDVIRSTHIFSNVCVWGWRGREREIVCGVPDIRGPLLSLKSEDSIKRNSLDG